MRKLVVTAFMSLDGVVQGPGGPDEDREGGFDQGGWAAPFFDEATIARMAEFVQRLDALLLGRKTYDIFASSWPLAEDDDPIGSRLNAVPKYVASRTASELTWRNSALLEGDVADAVRKLKEEDGGEIQVHGSGDLVQTLLAHDLVDEFQVLTFPVLVGSGKRLFGGGTVPGTLGLTGSTVSDTGIVISTYVRAGALAHGMLGPETGNW
ncbi:dihydrofolate reductase family protein [Yinghuangia sp. YIM S09857]|uniref:dihydrofolate reductase family protein n=1 Tax=Yinghuangia sp. YIM S09857 TaxID=3436929 RepID=UPI003F53A15B